MKTNNAAQDGEQYNDVLRRQNHEEQNLDICENKLFKLKYREKDEDG